MEASVKASRELVTGRGWGATSPESPATTGTRRPPRLQSPAFKLLQYERGPTHGVQSRFLRRALGLWDQKQVSGCR